MYATGINSGLPIPGAPGEGGNRHNRSRIARESNTDIGGNLIELIPASTMYQGNAQVITTASSYSTIYSTWTLIMRQA